MFATDSVEAPVERRCRGRSAGCDQVENPKASQSSRERWVGDGRGYPERGITAGTLHNCGPVMSRGKRRVGSLPAKLGPLARLFERGGGGAARSLRTGKRQ